MRYTIGDLRKHHQPSDIASWWVELPGLSASWWRWLLLEPGSGWLRWKAEWITPYHAYDEPPECYLIFPPARRVFGWAGAWAMHPWHAKHGACAWKETPSWRDVQMLRDPDRGR